MQVGLGAEQLPLLVEGLDDVGVRLLDEAAGEIRDPLVEATAQVDWVLQRDPVLLTEAEVVLAERDRCVDQAGALVGGDEVGEQDGVAARAVVGDVVEGGLVRGPRDRLAREMREHLRLLAEHRLDAVAGQHEDLVADPGPDVLDLRSGGDRRVGDQGPRGGRPDEQRVADLERPIAGVEDGEPHVDRGILDVVVAEGDLVGGEGGSVPGAIRNDLVVLVEAPVVPDAPQGPPDRLDVLVGHRHIGVVQVEPEADSLREAVPVLDVAEDGLAAAFLELGDPVFLDLLLRGDAQLALDLQLDGQPVAVPTRFPGDLMPGHRPEARIDVLEDPGQDVMGSRPAIGGRRALVEAPERRGLAVGERAVEDVALTPALEDLLLERWEGCLGRLAGNSAICGGFSQAARLPPRSGAADHGQSGGMMSEPSSSMVQRGWWATSHGYPSGSMKTPE